MTADAGSSRSLLRDGISMKSSRPDPDGPEMLPPAEMLFEDYPDDIPRIVSYKAKWVADTFQYENSRRNFQET